MQPITEFYKDLEGEILSALNCKDVFPCHYSLNNTVKQRLKNTYTALDVTSNLDMI